MDGFERVLLCDEKKLQRKFGIKGWPHLWVLDPETEEKIAEIPCGKMKSGGGLVKESEIELFAQEILALREKVVGQMAERAKGKALEAGQEVKTGQDAEKGKEATGTGKGEE